MKYIIRTCIVAAILILLTSSLHPDWRDVVSKLMVASMLTWVAARSQATGVPLLVALTGLYYIPQMLINIPEGVLFDVIEIGQAPVIMARELVVALGIAVMITYLFGKSEQTIVTSQSRVLSIPGFLWRLGVAIGVFVVCYFVAGMLIFPLVKEYYAVRIMPEPIAIASMVMLRGCALCVAGLLVVRIIPRAIDARMILAVSFPVLGCIALMIPDNELMPPMVRLVHTIEIVPYYTLYGILLVFFFGPHAHVNKANS